MFNVLSMVCCHVFNNNKKKMMEMRRKKKKRVKRSQEISLGKRLHNEAKAEMDITMPP